MRIFASGVRRKRARSKPTKWQRVLLFVVGACIGGVLGYGYLSSGAAPPPSVVSQQAAPWILVPAVVVGILAALYPDATFLNPGGRFRWHYDDDDR